MSPATDNFIHSLVEMSKAFEELPKVREQLEIAHDDNEAHMATIQRLELKLLDRNNEISDLERKLRDAEVARDDAELRFLEADDQIAAFRRLIDAFKTDAMALVKASEPRPEPEPVHVDPFANEPPAGMVNVPMTPDNANGSLSQEPANSGVSVPPNPTALSTAGDGPSPETATATPNAETGAGASSGRSPTDREWAGMTWSQARTTLAYVPYDKREWLEGGGREEDYYL